MVFRNQFNLYCNAIFLLFLSVSFLFSIEGLSQTIYNSEFFVNKELGPRYVYNHPAGFAVMDSTNDFYIQYSHIKWKYFTIVYRLVSDRGDIIIGFEPISLEPKLDSSKVLQKLFPGRTENTEYLAKIRSKADTLSGSKVEYYSHKKSWRLYYADNAGTYSFELDNPYEGKFNMCQVVFLHRDNCADVEVNYFYNDQSKKISRKVDKLVRRTNRMIRFKKHPACLFSKN